MLSAPKGGFILKFKLRFSYRRDSERFVFVILDLFGFIPIQVFGQSHTKVQ